MIAVMSDIFSGLTSMERTLSKGRYLFHQGDEIQFMYQVVEGEVQLIRRHRHGQKLILQRGRQGNILAEASLFTDAYHCDAIAAVGSVLQCFARKDILKRFECNPAFAKQ